jgi:ketosteroid isomerase-like protein
MSQENVEILRRGYGLLNSGQIEAWIDLFHPDAETHDLAAIPDAPVVRRGHEALRRWVVMMEEIWVDGRYEPEEFIDAGELVVVAVRAKARGRGSGVPMDVPIFQVFEMHDGKVRRSWSYLNRAEALDAVGLRE